MEAPVLLQTVMPEEQGHTAHLCTTGRETLQVAPSKPWKTEAPGILLCCLS